MAAEEVVFGVVTTGSESDLQTVTGIARSMVGRWGMSERIGPVAVLPPEGDPRMFGVSEGTLCGRTASGSTRSSSSCSATRRSTRRRSTPRPA
jgi:cell division protease FtsH